MSQESTPESQEQATAEPGEERLKSAAEKAMERADQLDAEAAKADAAEESEGQEKAPAQPEVIDYKDKYLRAFAELENYRKRVARERANWNADAIRSLASRLVDVLDSFQLAIDNNKSEDGDATFVKGVLSIRDQFTNVLEQNGVKKIDVAQGDDFDPDLHEALMMAESPDVEGQVVGAILRSGYMIEKRVLRPVQIQVLKGVPPAAD